MDTWQRMVLLVGKFKFLDSSSIVVSVHAWREPLAHLHLAIHLFISHNVFLWLFYIEWMIRNGLQGEFLVVKAWFNLYLLSLLFCFLWEPSKSNRNWLSYPCWKFAGFFDQLVLPPTVGCTYLHDHLLNSSDQMFIVNCLSRPFQWYIDHHFTLDIHWAINIWSWPMFGSLVPSFSQVPKEILAKSIFLLLD